MLRNEWIEHNMDYVVKDICDVVNIKTLRTLPESNMPFGEGVNSGLEFFAKRAHSLDLKTRNYNGYAIEVEIGTGDRIVGVLGHVDIVDGGDGWSTDPFKAEIIDERIYGRGTVDDKGPVVCALYAMKYIKDNNLLPPGVKVRQIIGGDEESLWECMDYYKSHAKELPAVSMVVDGNFPVIYCEKGLLDFNMIWHLHECDGTYEIEVRKMSGGSAKNIVPSHASCEIVVNGDEKIRKDIEKKIKDENIKSKRNGNTYQIFFAGKSTHAMNPEKGVNAISCMVGFLGDIMINRSSNMKAFVESYNSLIGTDYNGKKMNIFCQDKKSGPLTFNVGVIELRNDNVRVEANIRIPASKRYEEIVPNIIRTLKKEEIEYVEESFLDSIDLDIKSDVIETLMNVYQGITKDMKSEPIAIGGATYARCLENAVSFGPIFPGQEDRTHEANEFLSMDDIRKIIELYIEGICRLAEL